MADEVETVVSAELAVRREALARVMHGRSGSAKHAKVLHGDLEDFERFLGENGEEGCLYLLCAQVANGVSLKAACDGYGLNYGVVWSWMIADGGRMGRYEDALKGRVDGEVSETLLIADGDAEYSSGDIYRDRLKISTRFKRAELLDARRFGGKQSGMNINLGGNSLVQILSGMNQLEKVIEGESGE